MNYSNSSTNKNSIPQPPAQYVILDVSIPTHDNITTNVLTVSITSKNILTIYWMNTYSGFKN